MTVVICPQTLCDNNKNGICDLEEVQLEQEPYHAPECTEMYCSTEIY